jgi:hypothetical protein
MLKKEAAEPITYCGDGACYNHGICEDGEPNSGHKSCRCRNGWWGSNCEQNRCYFSYDWAIEKQPSPFAAELSTPCSGHGTCVPGQQECSPNQIFDDGTWCSVYIGGTTEGGRCECEENYFGDWCQYNLDIFVENRLSSGVVYYAGSRFF